MNFTDESNESVINCELPIRILRLATRNLLSNCLNSSKVIPNKDGLPRDWRGLAHLIGIKEGIDNTDPTTKILHLWQKNNEPPCTIKQLIQFLQQLDRYDIVDDVIGLIAKDIEAFNKEPEKPKSEVSLVVDDVDRHILTTDDVCRLNQGLDTQNYDAFVVFADEDIDFATELIETMEKEYGFKLCVKERDLVGGLPFEHKAIIELISDRCNRLIVIISPAYLKSSANKFVVDYAQAIGIEQGKRKIIPCLFEHCEIPLELRHIFMLNYPRSGRLYNFWARLRDSIQSPNQTSPSRVNNIIQRPVSQEIHVNFNEQLPDLKSALAQPKTNNQLKPKKEGVKFGSCSNLGVLETSETKRSTSEYMLNGACTSSKQVDTCPVEIKKEKKNETNLFKKLFHNHEENKSKISNVEKPPKKKKNWKLKIKVPFI